LDEAKRFARENKLTLEQAMLLLTLYHARCCHFHLDEWYKVTSKIKPMR